MSPVVLIGCGLSEGTPGLHPAGEGAGHETQLRQKFSLKTWCATQALFLQRSQKAKQVSENVGLIAFLCPSSKMALEFLADLSASPRPQRPPPPAGPHVPGPCVSCSGLWTGDFLGARTLTLLLSNFFSFFFFFRASFPI